MKSLLAEQKRVTLSEYVIPLRPDTKQDVAIDRTDADCISSNCSNDFINFLLAVNPLTIVTVTG